MTFSNEFHPRSINYLISKDRLTNFGGLKTLVEAFDKSPLRKPFEEALPDRSSSRSQGAYRLGLIQVASFLYGHDCLADLDKFRRDPYLTELMQGQSIAPRTMGDFLRDFDEENHLKLNDFLRIQSRAYRVQLEKMLKKAFKPSLAPHLFIDSTSHVQRGDKIEGFHITIKMNGVWILSLCLMSLGFVGTWNSDLEAQEVVWEQLLK